ncbi:MAG TPA: response regulator [Candidatus Angelobacter sp.]
MSLRILFADDSVTAQNMGRKILTEAGYDVVAVSNGAAAVKKIAEQKPDIIILDVYMPGYSGLEVCEKVRGSVETLKTPVLLTVGKMEPYKPEDGNRVKADGVIVKPFEASDLLAIVKRFEERIAQAPARQAVFAERLREEGTEAPLELAVEQPVASAPSQPMVEVPDHMATTSAFSDLLGAESPVSVNHFEAAPLPAMPGAAAPPVTVRGSIPEYELPVSWRDREEEHEEIELPVASTAPAHVPAREPAPVPPPAPVASRPLQIPVYQERESAARAYEFVPTSAPALGEIEIPREPELQETAAEATRNTVAEVTEPGLLTTRQQFEAMPSSAAEMAPVEHFEPAGFQDIPADIASHLPPPTAAAPAEKPGVEPLSNADFEARVAAAMSAYSHSPDAPVALGESPAQELAADPTDVVDEHPAAVPGLPDAAHALAPGHTQEAAGEYVHRTAPTAEPPASALEYQPEVSAEEGLPTTEAEASLSHTAQVAPAEVLLREKRIPAAERSAPVFEYRPPVSAAPEVTAPEAPASKAAEAAPIPMQRGAMAVPKTTFVTERPAAGKVPAVVEPHPSEPPVAEAVAISNSYETPASAIESELPAQAAAAAAGAASGADHHTIAQAVHRVMERLKPELVEEILRELKSKTE